MAVTDLFDRIERLLALEQLSVKGVGEALQLFMLEDEGLADRYFSVALGVGELGEVELRLPKEGARPKDGLLIAALDQALEVRSTEVERRFGPPRLEVPEPGGEPGIVYHRYPRPGGALSFEIKQATDRVVSVIIDRTDLTQEGG